MAKNIVRYGGLATDSGLSNGVWGDCASLLDHTRGYGFVENFQHFDAIASAQSVAHLGDYLCFSSTGGTAIHVATAGGGVAMQSDGADEAVSFMTAGAPFSLTLNAPKLWFEVELKQANITADQVGWFAGFLEVAAQSATVPIVAAGTLSDNNLCGWHGDEADSDAADTTYKADGVTAVTVQANAATLVADTYNRFGMKLNGGELSFWLDGQKLTTTKTLPDATGTDFPADAAMSVIVAMKNEAAASTDVTVRNLAVWQEY